MAKKKSAEDATDLVALDQRVVPHDGNEDHADIRGRILEARNRIDSARWEMSADLYRVHDSTLYQHWGYYSFDEYVSSELNMNVRTAQYLTSVYHCFYIQLSKELDESRHKEIMDRVSRLGWTKARSLVGVVDGGNIDEWLDRAEKIGSTELEGEAKRELVRKAGGDPNEIEKMKNIAFRVSEDQHEVIASAVEIAKGVAESDKRGHLISLICQDFVATNTGPNSGGPTKIKGRYLDRIGAMLGVRIVAVDKETGKVIHGKDVVEGLTS